MNKICSYDGGFWTSCGEQADDIQWQLILDGKRQTGKIHKNSECIFTRDNNLWSMLPSGFIQKCPVPYAIGSGANFALGAMLSGKSAIEAIKITAELSPFSGGGVDYVVVKGNKKKNGKR